MSNCVEIAVPPQMVSDTGIYLPLSEDSYVAWDSYNHKLVEQDLSQSRVVQGLQMRVVRLEGELLNALNRFEAAMSVNEKLLKLMRDIRSEGLMSVHLDAIESAIGERA